MSRPTRADLIWQSGFRAGPRIVRYVTRIMGVAPARTRSYILGYCLPGRSRSQPPRKLALEAYVTPATGRMAVADVPSSDGPSG